MSTGIVEGFGRYIAAQGTAVGYHHAAGRVGRHEGSALLVSDLVTMSRNKKPHKGQGEVIKPAGLAPADLFRHKQSLTYACWSMTC